MFLSSCEYFANAYLQSHQIALANNGQWRWSVSEHVRCEVVQADCFDDVSGLCSIIADYFDRQGSVTR